MNVLDKKDENIQHFNNSLKQKAILQYIKEPTRVTATISTCIDLCYTNTNMLAKAMVCNVSISDHELILDTCKTGPTIRERSTFYGRSYRNFDKDSFRKKLFDHKWNDLQNVDNTELKGVYFPQIVVDMPLWDYILIIDFF